MRAGAAAVAVAARRTVAKSQEPERPLAVCSDSPRAGTARESAEPCKSFSKQSVSSVARETVFVILCFSVDRQKSDGDSLCFWSLGAHPAKPSEMKEQRPPVSPVSQAAVRIWSLKNLEPTCRFKPRKLKGSAEESCIIFKDLVSKREPWPHCQQDDAVMWIKRHSNQNQRWWAQEAQEQRGSQSKHWVCLSRGW